MLEQKNADDFETAHNERERAAEHFRAVLAVHDAAIKAFEVLPTLPGPDGIIATVLRVKHGMKSTDTPASYLNGAQSMLEVIAAERNRGYQVIRGSVLIAVCAAFEYLIKATFVSQAFFNCRAATDLITDLKFKVPITDILGVPETEQWFAIADHLFNQMPDPPKKMHQRVHRFLTKYMYLVDRDNDIAKLQMAFDNTNLEQLDQAFLTRNCIVHNGGRVSSKLAPIAEQPAGDLIVFRDGVLGPLLQPMRQIAEPLSVIQF